jgi:hypothetical protein
MTDAPSQPPSVTPPAPPAPGKPVQSAVPKILLGCLAVIVVVGLALGGAVWWGAHKLRGYAEQAQKNPAVFAAKVLVAGNPELEIASEDDDHGTVSIRNTKTGDVVTMNADELRQGKLKFKTEEGEEIAIAGSGAKDKGAITVTSKEGTTVVGGGDAASLPSWVPAFPGARPQGIVAKKRADGGEEGALGFQTSEPVAKVLDFYQAQLEGKGFKVERTAAQDGKSSMGTLGARADGERRQLNVVAISGNEATEVNVQYASQGE